MGALWEKGTIFGATWKFPNFVSNKNTRLKLELH